MFKLWPTTKNCATHRELQILKSAACENLTCLVGCLKKSIRETQDKA